MNEITGGIIVNIVLWFLIKGGAAIIGLACGWGVAFWIAFFITWLGVVVISVSDGEIDFF